MKPAANFEAPPDYASFFKFKGGNIPPWSFLDHAGAERMRQALNKTMPNHNFLYPFALRRDSEDVAAFCSGKTGNVVVKVVHLGAAPGNELEAEFLSFRDWLLAAAKDSYEFLAPR